MGNLDRWMGEEVEWAVVYNKDFGEYSETDSGNNSRFFIRTMKDIRPPILAMSPDKSFHKTMLRNGGFVYVDLELVETCTPECRNHYELSRYNKAMETYMYATAQELVRDGTTKMNAWKTNVNYFDEDIAAKPLDKRYESDYYGAYYSERNKDITRGVHESYDTNRAKFRGKTYLMLPYLTFRQLFAGSGGYYGDRYVISPRALYITVAENDESRLKRPILCTKDEISHSSNSETGINRYRFHQTCGDGLRGDVPNMLKYGITSYMIAAIEDGIIVDAPQLEDPVSLMHEISANPEGPWRAKKWEGGTIDLVDYLNSDVLHPIEKLFETREVKQHDKMTLDKFKFIVDKLSQGSLESLRHDVEWINKRYFIEKFYDRYDLPEGCENYSDFQKKQALAFGYVDVANQEVWRDIVSGIEFGSDSLKTTIIFTKKDIADAVLNPPKDSRAAFRVWLARHYPDLSALDWGQARRGALKLNFKETDGWSEEEYESRGSEWLATYGP